MHLGRQYYYLSHTRRGLFPLTLGSHTQVFAELAPDTLAGPGDIVQRAADSAGEVDLDRALDITMEQWQLQTELLKARVQRVVEGEAAGYLGEGMDHVQCTSIVTKVAPSTAGDALPRGDAAQPGHEHGSRRGACGERASYAVISRHGSATQLGWLGLL
jgi:hypothetical protein